LLHIGVGNCKAEYFLKAMTSSTVSKLSAPEVIGQGRRRDERGSINAKMAADNHHNLLGKVSQSSSRPGSSRSRT
jgi:hypothetical protein